ncbi:hypothetical protein V466_05055 [Pseudomonas mandelii PD30]|uniref:Uncharacterized protein n=1 Tax=Pseudomonas mandelii PD30 TaxID=1419583 RepID=A0A059L9G8_9PSED|nr:hypothetical protein [Pseudomonas mandelii]KDD70740.1 hypothetical protein V466_05055 [Pseudomonas mandelii PD30]
MNSRVDKAILSRSAVLQKSYGAGGVFANPVGVTITAQTLPGGDLRIPLAALSAPLNYTIPRPTEPEDPDDMIEFRIREKGTLNWEELEAPQDLGPIAGRTWPLPKTIPMTPWMVEKNTPESPTEYEIQYVYWYGAVNDGHSDIVTYVIDRTAPYRVKQPPSNLSPKAATFPVDLPPTAVIDEAYIGKNPNGITLTAAAYGNYHATDVLLAWVGRAPDPVRDQPVLEIDLPSTREFTIPIDVFVNAEEGVNTVIYRVRDLVGHLSKVSSPASREVKRIADPTVFEPPVVPLANDDLIDLADCHLGVKLEATVPAPYAATDTLMGYWGTEELGEKLVSTAVDGKLVWDVPYSTIKSVYGNTDGDEETEFSYAMFRGNRRLGGNNDKTLVNIHYIGPINPSEPDPVNPALDQPVLTFPGGSTDKVEEGDFGKEATISIKLFAAPPTEEGWLVAIYYNNVQVGTRIPLAPGQENTTLTQQLPWDTIFAQGPGDKPLHWVLHTALNPNPTQCVPKDIPVDAFPIQTLAPEVQNLAGPLRRIGCSTLNFVPPGDGTTRRNLRVTIPKSAYTVAGETITLSFAAYTDATPPVLVPGTETTADLPVPDPYPEAGAAVDIGIYGTHFKPANRTNGVLTYTITRSGTTPTPASAEARHFMLFTNSEGQYCEEVNPVP